MYGWGVYLSAFCYNNSISENIITNNDIGVCLESSWVTKNNTVWGNKIANNTYGGILLGGVFNTVFGNNITENTNYGIYLSYALNNVVFENNVANNYQGYGVGIILAYSSNNTLKDNNMSGNPFNFEIWGITLSHFIQDVDSSNTVDGERIYYLISKNAITINPSTFPDLGYLALINSTNITVEGLELRNNGNGVLLAYTGDSQIRKNNIINNHFGITLVHSIFNSIYENNMTNNHYYGVELLWSSNNKIYHNNLINNTSQVSSYNSVNVWDDGYPSCGNYWSDFTGADEKSGPYQDQTGSDGIVDTPYVIDENNQDRYPFMSPYEIVAPITLDDYDGFWHNNDFTITLEATDVGSGVAETFYKINDGLTKTVSIDGQPLITTEGANNKLEYWSVDNAGNEELPHKTLTGIKLDKTAPSGSVIINNDATYTTSTSVTLTLTSTDATSGVAEMRFSNDNVTWSDWEAYAISKTWTILTGDGVKGVTVQYKDNAGLISSYSDSIILDTLKPTVNAGVDQTVNEDTLVTFDGSASADENGIATYTWAFTDVTLKTLTGKNPTYTFATPGTYTITLTVTDPAGNSATDTVIITVLDITKPTANAGLDRTVNEDTPITLDGSASSDNVAISAYTWTFTDVATKTLAGEKPAYTFNTPGVYTITLNVTDAAGNWATDTITITVLDITKPVANAGQDQTVNVGASVSFDASSSTDNVGIVSYEWNFGDGTTGSGKTTTHTYANAGTYTVTLTVKDAAGNTATHQITVTVQPTEAMPLWVLGVAAALIGIGVATTAAIIWKKRK